MSRYVAACSALVLAVLVLTWPIILRGGAGVSEERDQAKFHLPVIRAMIDQWPDVDLVDYQSTTSPGYHLLLALVGKVVGDDVVVFQLVSNLLSIALLLIAWRWIADRTGPWHAAALLAPLTCSSYYLGAAIWLTTDNAALLFVALAVGGAVFAAKAPATAGVWSMFAVGVRQVHLWSAAAPGLRLLVDLRARRISVTKAFVAGALLLLPFALVGYFAWLWGGLTPPAFAEKHDQGINLASLLVILALIGGYGVFLLPHALRAVWPRDRGDVVAVALGILPALVIESSYAPKPEGRWGGVLWEVVRRLPDIADRSIVFPIACGLGALVLRRFAQACVERGEGIRCMILFVAMAGWTAAQCVNSMAWQRYCEPLVLVFLAWLAALAWPKGEARRPIGPLLLTGILFSLSVWLVLRPAFLGGPA